MLAIFFVTSCSTGAELAHRQTDNCLYYPTSILSSPETAGFPKNILLGNPAAFHQASATPDAILVEHVGTSIDDLGARQHDAGG